MIGKALRSILDYKNISLETLSSQSGVPVETIRNLLYHKAGNPRLKTVLALSRTLNVPIESLISNSLHAGNTDDEQQLLEHYRQCSPHGRHLTRFIALMESEIFLSSKTSDTNYTIPIFIPAPSASCENMYTICDIRYIDVNCPDAFTAIRIPHNHFAPQYYKDDIILLANRFPIPGEHAVIFYENHIYLREFTISPGNKYTFSAIHGRGTDIHLSRFCKYTLMGTCIGVLRDDN